MKRVVKKPNEFGYTAPPPPTSSKTNLTSTVSASTSRINQMKPVYLNEFVKNQNQITSVSGNKKYQPIDGNFYLNLVEDTTRRLDALCLPYQIYIDSPSMVTNEDAVEQIRMTVGRARLLKNQKLAQFKSLCNKNLGSEAEGSEFATRLNDLAGFWDMVSIQVDEIYAAFERLDQMKSNHWRRAATAGEFRDSGGLSGRVGSSSVKMNLDLQKLNTMDLNDRIRAREDAVKKRTDEAKAKKSAGVSRSTWN
jgi:hypothetical protein